ncbi:MAG: orotidine-5'-phosphate decarboxylase [Granulosicoccus sp.]|nr:orotidine-5'-phosphate decarboxylase [Granulosicoccus sp.]
MTRIITALDFSDVTTASDFVSRIDPALTRLKVGNQLFTLGGPALIERFQAAGFDIFLDLKFHDIPNTVAAALRAVSQLGVWMVTVHASGGPAMLEAARNAVSRLQPGNQAQGTRVIAVTVLTSQDRSDLKATGLDLEPADQVRCLARLAHSAELDGVVCSPQEVGMVRELADRDFLVVTPGVRLKPESVHSNHTVVMQDGKPDDQRRTMSPGQAILAGSDYLVIGRPITQSSSPVDMLRLLNKEVDAVACELSAGMNTLT